MKLKMFFLISILILTLLTNTSCSSSLEQKISTIEQKSQKQTEDIESLYVQVDELSNTSNEQSYKDNKQLLGQILEIKEENARFKKMIYNIKIPELKMQIKDLKEELAILKNDLNKKDTKKQDTNQKSGTYYEAETELYENARDQYLKKDYKRAADRFREFLKKYPTHKLAANSQYWLGECYYSLEDFQAALNEFQKVLDFYKSSNKAPDAQIKIAFTYKQMGEREQAKTELKKVLQLYPEYERKSFVKSLLDEF